jgi:hypothetical protein
MSCNKCEDKVCKCASGSIPVMPPSACNTPECPDPAPCSEIIPTACIQYVGDQKLCGEDIVYEEGDTIGVIEGKIVDYFCERVGNVDNSINNLADVATSGAYSDLSGVPTNLSDFNNDLPVQGSLLINNTAFVDINLGNDTTGLVNNPAFPFLTVGGAQLALVTALGISGDPEGVIVIRPGSYPAELILLDINYNLTYYAEPAVELINFKFYDADGSATAKILGYATVFNSANSQEFVQIENASNVTVECLSLNKNGNVSGLISVFNATGVTPTLTVRVKTCTIVGFDSYIFNLRGAVNAFIHVEDSMSVTNTSGSTCRALYARDNAGLKGIVNLHFYCPKITTNGIAWELHNLAAGSVTYANVASVIGAGLASGMVRFWGEVGIVDYKGDIMVTASTSPALDIRGSLAITSPSFIRHIGNISSTAISTVNLINSSHADTELTLSGHSYSNTSGAIISSPAGVLNLKESSVKNDGAGYGINTSATTRIYNTGIDTVGESIYSSAALVVLMHNVIAKIDKNTNITNSLAAGFTFDANFISPKIS